MFAGKFLLDGSTNHQGDKIALGQAIIDHVCAATDPVTQDRHAVSESEDFRQAMTYVDDRGAAGHDLLHDPSQLFDA